MMSCPVLDSHSQEAVPRSASGAKRVKKSTSSAHLQRMDLQRRESSNSLSDDRGDGAVAGVGSRSAGAGRVEERFGEEDTSAIDTHLQTLGNMSNSLLTTDAGDHKNDIPQRHSQSKDDGQKTLPENKFRYCIFTAIRLSTYLSVICFTLIGMLIFIYFVCASFSPEYSADHPYAGGHGKYGSEKMQGKSRVAPVGHSQSTQSPITRLAQASRKEDKTHEEMRRQLEGTRKQQNENLLKLLAVEQAAEDERALAYKNTRSADVEERTRLELVFAEERRRSSEKIISLTKQHEKRIRDLLMDIELAE